MKQINKNYSDEEILRDTKHNSKAKEVFLKLLAKHKAKANPFGVVRSETTNNPVAKSNPRNEIEI